MGGNAQGWKEEWRRNPSVNTTANPPGFLMRRRSTQDAGTQTRRQSDSIRRKVHWGRPTEIKRCTLINIINRETTAPRPPPSPFFSIKRPDVDIKRMSSPHKHVRVFRLHDPCCCSVMFTARQGAAEKPTLFQITLFGSVDGFFLHCLYG